MWLLKVSKDEKTYQTMYETLSEVLTHIKKTQTGLRYEIIYLEPNN